MKKSILSMAACIMVLVMFSSFTMVSTESFKTSKASALSKSPVTFLTSATSISESPTGFIFLGTVTATGAINASGTYWMDVEFHGKSALHCVLVLTLPNGTITMRMNCNMMTGLGRWQVLDGTGSYQTLKGQGPLVMPNDIEEILTGTVSGL